MARDLPFSCRCGAVRGTIGKAGPRHGDYVVCHCTDCQNFANRFDAAQRVMDGDAGTLLYQSRCARMRIERGLGELRCLHLTEKPTLRWYAQCCDTPMFNTFRNGKIPYVTTLVGNSEAELRGRLLGEPIGHLFVEDDPNDLGPVHRMPMSKLMRRFFIRMVKDILSGDRRRSPLFDSRTLEPICAPAKPTKDTIAHVG
ncbi:DUF6151 family protein [Alteriqipengyuania lutimaris]|uniref:CENP-V/GFA domain-containing protein n=1 Tax=Alteriqipengyuania lutimaris TaxID=1538146 RepID=A0A395LG12_9SPHN|nr:DUF6151 family protein [Alteriqipengyuania lutimaris]MBB3035130.1 hypothetical protein [Alteriqipengyuania lutimaris]RDS75746.1 hypothetical protein DL238_13670 [Alteriqipengyuania lutimaris]